MRCIMDIVVSVAGVRCRVGWCDGCRADPADDEPRGTIAQRHGIVELCSGEEHRAEQRGEGIPRARDVEDVLRLAGKIPVVRPVQREHAPRPASDA